MKFETSMEFYYSIITAYPDKPLFVCPCDILEDDWVEYRLHPDFPDAESLFEITAVYRGENKEKIWP